MSIGITKAQLDSSSGAAPIIGNISGSSTAAPTGTINLSAVPGIVDWFVYTFLSVNAPTALGDLTESYHWRKAGGLKMLQSFRSFIQTAWFQYVDTPNVPPVAFSADAIDDGSIDSGDGATGPVWPMTAVAKCLSMRASNAINFPDGWGFSLRAPASTTPIHLDLYLGVKNLDLDVLAHLTDGTAPDVTVTISDSSGAGGALSFRKVSFLYNSASNDAELVINMKARNTQSPAIESSAQSFSAAVLHF